ncbi:MAG: DNA cytosine methyltransferase [Clostridia bacterium]|nr:DNA cytosine methyltransferase [Clostridia bacterium]
MIRSLELFCGTGGLALGLHQAGFEPTALIEWDKDSCDNIKYNIANGFADVKKWNVIQEDARLVNYQSIGNGVQFITGGPPCQPFSLGGKHMAHSDRRDMFPEAVRAVREIRPIGFIFENVKGLLRKSFSKYFNYIILQLTYPDIVKTNDMDWEKHLSVLEQHHTSTNHSQVEYNVVFRLLNAADYGVPQIRQRVIIVGFRKDIPAEWSFPIATHSKEDLLYDKYISGKYWEEHKISHNNRDEISSTEKDRILRYFKERPHKLRWQSVRDALSGLPDPSLGNANNFFNHDFRGGAKTYIGHSGSTMDEPSKTIKAGAHGVPGGENMIRLDNGTTRYYTVRESARIQTFPDDYKFCSSWTESMRQIGNAVPVKLAKAIGNSINRHFGGVL